MGTRIYNELQELGYGRMGDYKADIFFPFKVKVLPKINDIYNVVA